MSLVPILALAIDRIAGEPPTGWHPVVRMGRYLDAAAVSLQRRRSRVAQLGAGAIAIVFGCAGAAAVTVAARRSLRRLGWIGAITEGWLLSTLLAERMLTREAKAVDTALTTGVVPARRVLAGLVSRDVTELSADGIREAAIESLAENASDSILAPLWWYAIGGLPTAAVYRFVNTADAMWGYRDARWEWRGKVAARADDVLNWVPSRLTALLLAPGLDPRQVAREARAVPSPNAGWPMAAVALRWDVRLGKAGVYLLNPSGRRACSSDIDEVIVAVRRMAAAAAVCAALLRRSFG